MHAVLCFFHLRMGGPTLGMGDVPLTPTAIQFDHPPNSYQVEHFAIGFENPIDVDDLKRAISSSILLKIPRFSSLLVTHRSGRKYWRRTHVDLDKHFVVDHSVAAGEGGEDEAVNSYVAALAFAPPLSNDKPLWEAHVLVDVRCLVLRVHHAIGDGTSLTSVIRELGWSEEGRRAEEEGRKSKSCVRNWRRKGEEGVLGYLRYVWLSTVFMADYLARFTVVRDRKTVLNAKDSVNYQNWPQKLATAKFSLEDVMLVKKAIPNATINDVLCGVIWGGLMKYLDARSSSGKFGLKEGQRITGILVANLRRESGLKDLHELKGSELESWWGNKVGLLLLPIYYTKKVVDPLDYTRKAKSILDKKKQSAEASLSFKLRNFMLRSFGIKVLNYFICKGSRSTTFGFSNVVGPSKQIHIASNPVKYLRLSVSSSPVRIMMHVMSYMNNLDLQILVAEDVVPDPNFLASCFMDTLHEMKDTIQ